MKREKVAQKPARKGKPKPFSMLPKILSAAKSFARHVVRDFHFYFISFFFSSFLLAPF